MASAELNNAEELRKEIVIDGIVYDAETGEELRVHVRDGFEIADQASFDWVMEKILDADANVARQKIKRDSILENCNAEIKRAEQRSNWLRERFGSELQSFASTQLEGKSTKTLKSAFGSVSFRTVKGGLRVIDPAKALEWAKAYWKDAVKVSETFQISLVPDNIKDEVIGGLGTDSASDPHPEWVDAVHGAFEIKDDEDKFDIKTGVKL